MKLVALIFAVLSIGLAGSSIYLLSEVRGERMRADNEAALRATWEKRANALMARAGRDSGSGLLAGDAAGAIAASRPAAATGPAQPAITGNDAAPGRRGGLPLVQLGNPYVTAQGRELMRMQNRINAKRAYGDLMKQMKLTPAETESLLNLLADQQGRQMDAFQRMGRDRDRATIERTRVDLQAQDQTEITALLGQDKGQQFAKYQGTMAERAQANFYADQLDSFNAPPMSDSQKEQLIAALSEERAAVPQPDSARWGDREGREAIQSWQEDYYRRVFDRASSFLTSDQYQRLRQFQDMQLSVRRQQLDRVGQADQTDRPRGRRPRAND